MFKKILLGAIIFLVSSFNVNAGQTNDDVKEFIRILSKKTAPTLSDYYRFCGQGSEEELKLALNVCEKKGWVPALTNSSCMQYIEKREANRSKTPSLYFEWLKTKLPQSMKLKFIKTDRIRGKDIVEYDLIHATMQKNSIVFYRTIGDESTVDQFGKLSIGKINDVPVSKLLENDLASHK